MKRSSWVVIVVAICLLSSGLFMAQASASDEPASSGIYVVRLQSISLSDSLLSNIQKSFAAKVSDTFVYVSLLVDGETVWVSPKKKVMPQERHFDWPNDVASSSGLLWSQGENITVKVFLSDDAKDASLSAGGVGGVGGAGLGAAIGGALAGLVSGGLGAPAGAVIGAAIGGAVGGTSGALAGAISSKDTLVMEKYFEKPETLPLAQKIEFESVNSMGERATGQVLFSLDRTQESLASGMLSLQKKYLVRLKSINLSSVAARKGGKKTDENRYYLVFQNGKEKVRWPAGKATISIPSNREIHPECLMVLVNRGETTELKIFEQDKGKDDLVFSSTVAKLDGKAWVFQGKCYPDDHDDSRSYMVCESFGPME